MQKSRFKKMSFEDKFDRKYACWAHNHGGWSKYKTANRRMARRAMKKEMDISQYRLCEKISVKSKTVIKTILPERL